MSLVASPIYWLTGNPLAAYNLSLFLTWPLSAFAVVPPGGVPDAPPRCRVPGRPGVGVHPVPPVGARAPAVALGLLASADAARPARIPRRAAVCRWLVLFGAAWLLSVAGQRLLHALWRRADRHVAGVLLFEPRRLAGAAGHPRHVGRVEPAARPDHVEVSRRARLTSRCAGLSSSAPGSAPSRSRGSQVSSLSWLWGSVLREDAHNLFPGVTAAALVVLAVGCLAGARRPPRDRAESRWRRLIRAGLGVRHRGEPALAILAMLIVGPWRVSRCRRDASGWPISIARSLWCCACGGALRPPHVEHASRARAAEPVCVLRRGHARVCRPRAAVRSSSSRDAVVLDPAPYAWLLSLPGFDRLRVPTRFWMLGTLCLAIAAGLAFRWLVVGRPRRSARRRSSLVAACLLLDGWVTQFPMAAAPELWPRVERRDQTLPILELPLGPEWDAAGTYRAIWHRRRAVNGVSGYDPPHYAPLQAGLNAHDPGHARGARVARRVRCRRRRRLRSRRRVGALCLGGRRRRGRRAATACGPPTGFRQVRRSKSPVGAACRSWPCRRFLHDARVDRWTELERSGATIRSGRRSGSRADLGEVREVGGITHALGEYARDFPRLLAIDVSLDGSSWEQVWRGRRRRSRSSPPRARRARRPCTSASPRARRASSACASSREHKNMWRVAELTVHGAVGSR